MMNPSGTTDMANRLPPLSRFGGFVVMLPCRLIVPSEPIQRTEDYDYEEKM